MAVAPFNAAKAKEYQVLTTQYLGVPVEKTIDLGSGVEMQFVLIPAGEFMMGSNRLAAQLAREYDTKAEYFAGEYPQHQVRIPVEEVEDT